MSVFSRWAFRGIAPQIGGSAVGFAMLGAEGRRNWNQNRNAGWYGQMALGTTIGSLGGAAIGAGIGLLRRGRWGRYAAAGSWLGAIGSGILMANNPINPL